MPPSVLRVAHKRRNTWGVGPRSLGLRGRCTQCPKVCRLRLDHSSILYQNAKVGLSQHFCFGPLGVPSAVLHEPIRPAANRALAVKHALGPPLGQIATGERAGPRHRQPRVALGISGYRRRCQPITQSRPRRSALVDQIVMIIGDATLCPSR